MINYGIGGVQLIKVDSRAQGGTVSYDRGCVEVVDFYKLRPLVLLECWPLLVSLPAAV